MERKEFLANDNDDGVACAHPGDRPNDHSPAKVARWSVRRHVVFILASSLILWLLLLLVIYRLLTA